MFLTKDNRIKWWSLAIGTLVTFALVVCGMLWFDIPVFNFLRRFNCGFFDVLGDVFTVKNWLILSFLVMLVFYVKKSLDIRPRIGITDFLDKVKNSYAFYVFCSVLCAGIVGGVLKLIIGRGRPIFYEALNMTGFVHFSTEWAFNSMPSGHTFASFAGLVVIGLLAPRVRWFTWGLATVIGISRVCVGAHRPSDVILGAFIGMVAADVVKSVLARHIK